MPVKAHIYKDNSWRLEVNGLEGPLCAVQQTWCYFNAYIGMRTGCFDVVFFEAKMVDGTVVKPRGLT